MTDAGETNVKTLRELVDTGDVELSHALNGDGNPENKEGLVDNLCLREKDIGSGNEVTVVETQTGDSVATVSLQKMETSLEDVSIRDTEITDKLDTLKALSEQLVLSTKGPNRTSDFRTFAISSRDDMETGKFDLNGFPNALDTHVKSDLLTMLNEYEKLIMALKTLDSYSTGSKDTANMQGNRYIESTQLGSSMENGHRLNPVEEVLKRLLDSKEELKKKEEEKYLLEEKVVALTNKLTDEKEDKEERIQSLNQRLKLLEEECSKFKQDAAQSKEKLLAHDSAAKRAITAIQNESSVKVAQVTKMYEEAVVEKDGLLIRISKLERELEHSQKNVEIFEKKNGESNKELERLKQNFKDKDLECKKLQVSFKTKEDEVDTLQDEVTNLNEELTSSGMKIKWAQNKLKQELEAHKETKKQVTALTAKLKEAKEEGEQIRLACQDMIKRYQDSEEMKSVQLDHKLKETENAVKLHEHEIAMQDEAHRLKTQELEALKANHRKAKETIAELQAKNSGLQEKLSEEASKAQEYINKVRELQDQKIEWAKKITELESTKDEIKRYDQQIRYYQANESNLRTELQELESELKSCRQKEAELLTFSEKLAQNSAQAMTSATNLEAQVEQLSREKLELANKIKNLEDMNKERLKLLDQDTKSRDVLIEQLKEQINQKDKAIEELSLSLEEAKDDVKVVKRKNAATLKDLQRQLQQSKKKLDQMENNYGSQENLSTKSRTSSNCSLDKLSNSSPHYSSNPSLTAVDQINAEYSIVQPYKNPRSNQNKGEIEVDKSLLVERICKLQKAHAKKNDKLEFLEEHINVLVEEIQRKNRIIAFYVMREEAGTLAPDKSDRNKAEMSRRGGIMASVYSSRPSDKDMTLELSLEINRKLQAVLEDTLLKNITLKESINTLGDEISRMQKEKRKGKEK